jgi:hypothetical protein
MLPVVFKLIKVRFPTKSDRVTAIFYLKNLYFSFDYGPDFNTRVSIKTNERTTGRGSVGARHGGEPFLHLKRFCLFIYPTSVPFSFNYCFRYY